MFPCALNICPWTVNSYKLWKAQTPHITVALVKEVRGENRFDNRVSPFIPVSIKCNHSNDRSETIWKFSCWQESGSYPAFLYFLHILLLIENSGFHAKTHTEGPQLCAEPSIVPCRWKIKTVPITRHSPSESTATKAITWEAKLGIYSKTVLLKQ